MPDVTIYHNPRCSKSRQTLALLEECGVQPNVIEYLKDPPDAQVLESLVKKLSVDAKDLVRQKEFKELGVAEPTSDESWIELMVLHPKVIQRPIVVAGSKAAIGRPPESVLSIL